jgi:predicted RNA-binding Zn-ribbon protein involved in translation (DUF1610 family)
MKKQKYTKEVLEPLVKESCSIAEVLKKLGLKISGGSFSHISKKIKTYEIDTSHMLGQKWTKGKRRPNITKSWEVILQENRNGKREQSYLLRRALIESGRPYICEECGQGPIWKGKELRIQVDHINRDWEDNRKENLRFLCPNCHTQTDGFNGSKGLAELTKSYNYYKQKPKEQWKKRKYANRKTRRPAKDLLEKMAWEKPTTHIAQDFGVTSNAVKKWYRFYKIDYPQRGYWAKKQAGKL